MYIFLQQYWWLVVSLLGAILVFLLFVQGGNSLLFCLGKTEEHRKMMVNSTGRKWEFTFTTLVTFGGAFFASFPLFYSTSFGGAYWLWMIILFSFVLQAVSYEFQSKENEKEIWNYICTNDHLHARDPMVIRYYMKPAPAVDMLGAQAPALIGTWMGARIIASYMKKHKDMKLKDLLEFTDYHVMLSESNYLAS